MAAGINGGAATIESCAVAHRGHGRATTREFHQRHPGPVEALRQITLVVITIDRGRLHEWTGPRGHGARLDRRGVAVNSSSNHAEGLERGSAVVAQRHVGRNDGRTFWVCSYHKCRGD